MAGDAAGVGVVAAGGVVLSVAVSGRATTVGRRVGTATGVAARGAAAKVPEDRQVGNLPHGQRGLPWLANGAVAAGVAWLVQTVAIEFYARWTARSRDLWAPLPELLAAAARLMGVDAAANGIVGRDALEPHPLHRFAATWDLLLRSGLGLLLLRLAGRSWGFLAWQQLPAGSRAAAWCQCGLADWHW